MTEDKTIQMPDTLLTDEELFAVFKDNKNPQPDEIRKAQDAKTKREIAEWLKNVNHYTSHDKYRGNMLVVRTDDYIRFQEWAAGIGES